MSSFIYKQGGEAMKSTVERKRKEKEAAAAGAVADGGGTGSSSGSPVKTQPVASPFSSFSPFSLEPQVSYAPQVRFVDGKLVVDTKSLIVPAGSNEPVVYDNDITYETGRRVTSATYSKRSASERWTNDETNRFYDGLQYWGTDFTLIAKMFPNRDRRQIKFKYKREERANPTRLNLALRCRKPVGTHENQTLFWFSNSIFFPSDAETLAVIKSGIQAENSGEKSSKTTPVLRIDDDDMGEPPSKPATAAPSSSASVPDEVVVVVASASSSSSSSSSSSASTRGRSRK